MVCCVACNSRDFTQRVEPAEGQGQVLFLSEERWRQSASVQQNSVYFVEKSVADVYRCCLFATTLFRISRLR